MSLVSGLYNIRFVPKDVHFPYLGGAYATTGVIDEPIRAEALDPSATGEQKWKVQAVEGKPDTYFIFAPGINSEDGPDAPGFGVDKNRGYSEPVWLRLEPTQWVLTQVDAENGLYSIQAPPGGPLGVSWAVTVPEEESMLFLQPYPVTEHEALPRWQFVPSDY